MYLCLLSANTLIAITNNTHTFNYDIILTQSNHFAKSIKKTALVLPTLRRSTALRKDTVLSKQYCIISENSSQAEPLFYAGCYFCTQNSYTLYVHCTTERNDTMATARKLPSGNYRCRVYLGKENGKDTYKSFTAKTKKEAEKLAIDYLNDYSNKRKQKAKEITFAKALEEYIELKEKVLSPSTIRGYKSLERNFSKKFPRFYQSRLCDITQEDIQKVISSLSVTNSPKTVRNYHGIISSILGSEMIIKTSMPQKIIPDLHIPSDAEIKTLIKAVNNTELEIPVLLGAFCMMRRGEICGLSMSDVDFKTNTIHIHHSLVIDDDKKWKLKAPKNSTSDRYVDVPDFVMDKIKEKGYITKYNPDNISTNFTRVLKRNGITHFRFHDLRHYSASIRHALNIPDAYIMAEGGWKSDAILKSVYRHAMKDKKNEMQKRATKHFSKLYATKHDTNN